MEYASVIIALVMIGINGIGWLVFRSHSNDSTAHKAAFDGVLREIKHHNESGDAHQRAETRISNLDSAYAHMLRDMVDIKLMLRELLDRERG